MADVVYPLALPGPLTAPFLPAENRLLSSLPGKRQARALQRDRRAGQQTDFIFTFEELAIFMAWLESTLVWAGAWFAASWPQPQGGVGVRRFVSEPSYPTYYPNIGWHVSAEVEVRGRGLIPSDCISVDLSNLSTFAPVSGNQALFTSVQTPYGPGLNISAQNSGVEARMRRTISRAVIATISVKFQVTASNSDDAGRFEIQSTGGGTALTFIPRRETFYDGLRRALIGGSTGSAAISAAALVIDAWYQLELVVAGGLHAVLTRLSDGVVETTSLPGVTLGTDLVSFSFSADSGGTTCPVTYTNLHIC